MSNLEKACDILLRKLVKKHDFLHPHSPHHDVWGNEEARTVVADLVDWIRYNNDIYTAIEKNEWGKQR